MSYKCLTKRPGRLVVANNKQSELALSRLKDGSTIHLNQAIIYHWLSHQCFECVWRHNMALLLSSLVFVVLKEKKRCRSAGVISQARPAETPNRFRDVHEKTQWPAAREFVCACTCADWAATTGKLFLVLSASSRQPLCLNHHQTNLGHRTVFFLWQGVSCSFETGVVSCSFFFCAQENNNSQQPCLAFSNMMIHPCRSFSWLHCSYQKSLDIANMHRHVLIDSKAFEHVHFYLIIYLSI